MRAGKTKVGREKSEPASRHLSPFWRIGVIIGAVMLSVGSIAGQGLSHQESAKSVVKITSQLGDGKEKSATGFVWQQPTYVVTALHAVAGSRRITVYFQHQGKEREAEIVKVHQESDLALLRLKTDDLKPAPRPLTVATAAPNLTEEHYIWGYPRDVNSMQGDHIRFSLSLEKQPTMESIFKSEAHFQKAVGDQGYPRYRTKILRVSSSIQPGHSGAPILDKTGMIVGIGDGGLHQGIARVNWAVPARDYLSALQQSTEDPQRVKPSRQDVHFSSVVDSSIDVRIGQGGAPSAGDEVLHLVWSAPIAEILDSATEEDSEDCREFLEEAQKETGHDIGEDVVDVYEDYETGATLAVPRGVALKYDPESRLLEARSPSGKIVMYVRVVNNETWEEGENAMAAYDRYLAALADWKDDPDMEDERQEEEGFRHLEKSRIALDEDGNPHSQLFANLMIDQNDFLGTAVVVKDLAGLTKEDLRIFYVMLVSVDLASFAIQ